MKHQGFSLIEMMVAITAGMAIILTATAGFQAASKSMAVATTISMENKLIGIGILTVFDEADFWTSYDNDSSPNGHLMRRRNPVSTSDPNQGNALVFGLPFAPLLETVPLIESVP